MNKKYIIFEYSFYMSNNVRNLCVNVCVHITMGFRQSAQEPGTLQSSYSAFVLFVIQLSAVPHLTLFR